MTLDITRISDEVIANYKKEQKEMMNFFKIGLNDPLGNITNKILSITDEYIIYEVDTNIISE